MSAHAHDALSEKVIRVDTAEPLSESLGKIRQQRASHVAVFAKGECLGVSGFNEADLVTGDSTFEDLAQRQSCPVVTDTAPLDELVRVFADSTADAQVVNDSDGNFVGVVTRQSLLEAMIEDRKESDEALRESEIRSRALREGSPVCNKIIDLDGRLQYMSSAGVNQLKIPDVTQLYGCTYPSELYPMWIRAPLVEKLDQALAGEISSVDCPLLDADGNEVWYHTTFLPACDDEGRIEYIIASSVNITERRRAEEEVRQIQEKLARVARLNTMGEMATGLAHELNQPLAAISNYVFSGEQSLAASPSPDIEYLQTLFGKLEGQATRAGEIIRRLRDFIG